MTPITGAIGGQEQDARAAQLRCLQAVFGHSSQGPGARCRSKPCGEVEDGAEPELALEGDVATQQACDLVGDGEPEAGPIAAAVAGRAGRQLEQLGKKVGSDARTVIDDADEGMSGIFAASRSAKNMCRCAFD